jgi:hypothetical protein
MDRDHSAVVAVRAAVVILLGAALGPLARTLDLRLWSVNRQVPGRGWSG